MVNIWSMMVNDNPGWWFQPTPLKNMSSSVGMMKFPTEWTNNPNVPNHQSDSCWKPEMFRSNIGFSWKLRRWHWGMPTSFVWWFYKLNQQYDMVLSKPGFTIGLCGVKQINLEYQPWIAEILMIMMKTIGMENMDLAWTNWDLPQFVLLFSFCDGEHDLAFGFVWTCVAKPKRS